MLQWDIFCRVVDNFGDIGVCWRLARALAARNGTPVRLWVDQLESFRKICPDVDTALARQQLHGVDIRHWNDESRFPEPGDVVLEAFGCRLPERYIEAMVAKPRPTVWINLEYLSAERWVESHHRLPSPHPKLPLVKHFFFPGFTASTGGLIIEPGLAARRDAWLREPDAAARLWTSLGVVPNRPAGELRVSLFSYAKPALPALVQGWRGGTQQLHVLVPEGQACEALAAITGRALLPGQRWQSRALTLTAIPFVDQFRYDELLWACDLNFVRGEDSFVRAQLAARPMVWLAYPQDDDAHLAKVGAFLDLYSAGLDAAAKGRLQGLWKAWNGATAGIGDVTGAWRTAAADWPLWTEHARAWAARLVAGPELVENLVRFCQNKLK